MVANRYIKELKNLNYFFSLEPGVYYCADLNLQAPLLVQEANIRKIKIYDCKTKNPSKKNEWVKILAMSNIGEAPKFYKINLSNGVILLNMANFDKKQKEHTDEEIQGLIVELDSLGNPTTPSSWLREQMDIVNKTRNGFKYCYAGFDQQFNDLIAHGRSIIHGGAIHVMERWLGKPIKKEVHIDFHQMYGYILINNVFPDITSPLNEYEGYYPDDMAIYYCGGTIKLKPKGYPMFDFEQQKKIDQELGMTIDLADTMGYWFTAPEFQVLKENYDISDLTVFKSYVYTKSISGKLLFENLVKTLYTKRMTETNRAIKTFYKLANECLPGNLEKAQDDGSYYNADLEPVKIDVKYFNCIIGAFVTSYGRIKLNRLIRSFDYEDVIGYDTDSVFVALNKDEIPPEVKFEFGNYPGQLHWDGNYSEVRHLAPKQYYGWNDDYGTIFGKFAAVPNGDEIAEKLFEVNHDPTLISVDYKVWSRTEKCFKVVKGPVKIGGQRIW